MRTEDILSNFEFRTIKKKLKQEFPFFMDIQPIKNHNQYQSLLFMDIIVDVNKFLRHHNLKVSAKDKRLWRFMGDEDGNITLSSVYLNLEESHIRDFEKMVKKIMNRIHRSPAIPEDLKLPMTPDVSRIMARGDIDDDLVDN